MPLRRPRLHHLFLAAVPSLALAATLSLAPAARAGEPARWLRYPAISPDGRSIAFSYQGDIWVVPVAGGDARPLTVSESYEYMPVWSHDGASLAFASDRYGNMDIFVMPAAGGEARRLTAHSTGEAPSTFTPDDAAVLFAAARQDVATNAQYPTPNMSELYRVPVGGGRVTQVLPVPAIDCSYSSRGDRLLFHDVKGVENSWRKHHTSSVTRDIWLYDFKANSYTMLTTFAGEDRDPVFGANDDDFFYLSEQSGSLNVYRSSVSNPGQSTALTKFTRHPVRFLSRATDNTLCFAFDGDIYTLKPGAEPVRVPVTVAVDGRANLPKVVPVNDNFTEAKLAPNGKEFAYVFRGEIFVSSVEGGLTKRITDTPYQERTVDWSPDGRSLVYAAEVDNNWNVYRTRIARDDEPYFYVSTVLNTEPVVATSAEEYQPAFSPDGKEVAYLENRVTLKVINLDSKATRLILPADRNYSYADGDQYYQWSPDGKWFLVQFGYPERMFDPEVGLIASDGKGELRDLTLSGYDDTAPKWSHDGTSMIWGSNREGGRSQGGDPISGDVYQMFFTKAAFERYNLTKEELALVKEQEEKKKDDAGKEDAGAKDAAGKKGGGKGAKAAEGKDGGKGDDKKGDKPAPLAIDWNGLTERKARLTEHTSPAADWALANDGEKLYFITSFQEGNDLWVVDLRKHEPKLLCSLGADGASLQMSADGKMLLVLADGKPLKVDPESGDSKPLKTSAEMVLKTADERAYIFDHAWRQFKEKFYDPGLHGVDWDFYHDAYRRFLPYINNNYDFSEMLSEMLGEVNASHTGCNFGQNVPNGAVTAALGLLYDVSWAGDGMKIAEVIAGGPLDRSTSKVKAGCLIEQVDGRAVTPDFDYYLLLDRKVGQLLRLSLLDPATNTRWEETVKAISRQDENELLYKRWVAARRADVDRLSGGKLGYVHVRSMSDASMRVVFSEALGRAVQKEGLVVDTRFNGGGNIHEQLSDFLSGKAYFDVVPHGQWIGQQPYDKWKKPSIVLMGESNYSDAHLFPVAFKAKGLGKTVGMPVPGTGTFVWWERQIDRTLVFGIPMGGWRTMDGKFCENNQLEPDVKVRNMPGPIASGEDQQLEAAVKELLKK